MGPLAGIRIIELAGIGPGPFAGMMLADHGAEVIRVDRPGARIDARDPLLRSRTLIGVDLKSPDGVAVVRDLCRNADGLIEGFRPGVTERLGLERFGVAGEPFDPLVHEALMPAEPDPASTVATCAQVFQQGYRLRGGKVLRPARVAVSEPGAAPQSSDVPAQEQ